MSDGQPNGNGQGPRARPRLQQRYSTEIVPALAERFGYSSVMQVPRLEKIVLNMGLGEAVREPKLIEIATEDLQTIAGQKPIVTKARKSIAGFKLRAGVAIGAKVTLRGARMWERPCTVAKFTVPPANHGRVNRASASRRASRQPTPVG